MFEPFHAAWALHEMIGLAFGDAIRVEAGIARNLGHHRSRFNFRFPQ
jgi:hypothetical protein